MTARAAPFPIARVVPRRLAVGSWALYDLANTIFSLNIVSLYFAVWVIRDLGGRDADYAFAASGAQAVMLIAAPVLGAISDQTGRRMPFLVVTTIACCVLTALLGVRDLGLALLFFAGAYICFQAGLVFYDALLPAVSSEADRGTVGGIGVGVGYLGSFIGLGVGLAILAGDPSAKPLVFQATAGLFLIFALPCFFFVRERRRAVGAVRWQDAIRRALDDVRATVARARRYPDLVRFLTGRVFYADAANTLILFMGIYVIEEVGFSEREKDLVLAVGIATAVVGGLVWGRIVDRIGPKRTLDYVLVLWMVVFALVAAIGLFGLPQAIFWGGAALAGFTLAGTWSADRPFMLRLTPPRHLGQFYGLYSMVGRFAAMIGPLLWALVVDGLGLGRPAAVLSLLVMVVIAYVVLGPARDAVRQWGQEDLPD